jgi:hypothetical protein
MALSIKENREYGGTVCRALDGRFVATNSRPAVIANNSDDVAPTTCETAGLPNSTWAGRYHTHKAYGQEGLSSQDQINAEANLTKPWLVASPCGAIYEYSEDTTPRRYMFLPPGDLIPVIGNPCRSARIRQCAVGAQSTKGHTTRR